MNVSFDENLKRYAALIVRVGLNIQPGQRLIIGDPSSYGVSLHAAPLVRQIVARAYEAGAKFVDVFWSDEQVRLARFEHASKDSFEEYPGGMFKAMIEGGERGDALLSLVSNNPNLLKDQDPELVSIAQRTTARQMQPVREYIRRNTINWCVAAASSPGWAAVVFPETPPTEQQERLWQAIFKVCRLDESDPTTAWQEHIRRLQATARYLTGKQYRSLHYRGPGTNLVVGLPDGHLWLGGGALTEKGIAFSPNLPTEEVFTLPHRQRVDGTVTASRPLSYGGTLVENLSLWFQDGRITDLSAKSGEQILRKLIETDEGAARLGEVALVPQSSPISQSGVLFYNTLLDENAANHLAIGAAYKTCLSGAESMSEQELEIAGGNQSLTHVDFMIGSGEMDVDGLTANGSLEPLMRHGEWSFTAV